MRRKVTPNSCSGAKTQNGGTGGEFDAVAAKGRTTAFLEHETFLQRYHAAALLSLSNLEALQKAQAWQARRRGGSGPSAAVVPDLARVRGAGLAYLSKFSKESTVFRLIFF